MGKEVQSDPFEAAIARCRAAYNSVLELENRTHMALFNALSKVYYVWHKIQNDVAFRSRFDEALAARPKRERANPALFLVKYALFPHIVEFGSGNKPDQDKASRYAKLLN